MQTSRRRAMAKTPTEELAISRPSGYVVIRVGS